MAKKSEDPGNKQSQRDKLAGDIDAFLKKGGQIEKIEKHLDDKVDFVGKVNASSRG